MTVILELNPKTEEVLQRKAHARGDDLRGYLEEVIQKEADRVSLDERLAPVRKQFEESGMSEEQLDEFLNGVRRTINEERRANGTV